MPRRWFQIHLSTGIVLMFVAGGLMWLNNVPGMLKPVTITEALSHYRIGYTKEELPEVGWPWKVYGEYKIVAHNFASNEPSIVYAYNLQHESEKSLGNLGAAAFIFFGTAFLLERRIRRKQPPSSTP